MATGLLGILLLGALLAGTTGVASAQTAEFTVTIDGTNSPVNEGEQLHVTATVENTGDGTDTQRISLLFGDYEKDSTEITLEPAESRTVELTWATADGDAGTYTARVVSEDDSDSSDVLVQDAPAFEVAIDGTNSPVTAGAALTVDATIENTGGSTGTQAVALTVGDVERDSSELTLEPSESRSVEFTWETADGDAGEYTAAVASEDDADDTAVAVESPAFFDVSLVGTNAPVTAGEELVAGARVTNTGSGSGTQEVALTVGGTQRDATTVTLDAGKSVDVYFDWVPESADTGTHELVVASADGEDATNVTVEPDAWVTIDDQTVADSAYQEVVVASTRLPEGGFVTIYNTSVGDGVDADTLIGASSYLEADNEFANVRVDLDDALSETRTLYAVIHEDSDTDNRFEFGDGNGDDGPYTRNGEPVSDSATVRVATPTPTATSTPSPTPTATPTPTPTTAPTATPTPWPESSPTPAVTPTETTDGSEGPGFGLPGALLALTLGSGLLARRRA